MCWIPEYKAGSGNSQHLVQINEASTNYCPVDLIKPETLQILQTIFRSGTTEGCSMFGPIVAKWPAWFVDAVAVVESCRAQQQRAKYPTDN